MNLGPSELLIVLAIMATWVLPVLAIIDAAAQPESSYEAIGASKTTQVVVLIVSAVLCGPIGTIIAIFYLVSTRRRLRST